MSYFALGDCCNCHNPFTFNPDLVPAANGEPICRACVEWANPKRIASGLQPIVVLPGAYNEAVEETDTDFQAPAGFYEEPYDYDENDEDYEPYDTPVSGDYDENYDENDEDFDYDYD